MLWDVLNGFRMFLRFGFRSLAFTVLFLVFSLLLVSCTEYEREGVNSRPFNEPTEWEQNPYGNAFRN